MRAGSASYPPDTVRRVSTDPVALDEPVVEAAVDREDVTQVPDEARTRHRDLSEELEKKIKERMNIGPQLDVPAGVDPVTGEVEF